MLKRMFKFIARGVAAIVVFPLWLACCLQGAAVGVDATFQSYSQLLSLVPGKIGVYLRWAFYRFVFSHCGTDAHVGFGSVFSHSTAELGDRSYIGVGCMIGDVTLGEDVLIGSHASIINGNRQHGIERTDIPVREQPGEYPRVTLGADAWIGDRSIVMTHVGAHAVVGAGSVVTKPVEEWAIVAGNPAKVIGSRKRDEDSRLDSVEQDDNRQLETTTESRS